MCLPYTHCSAVLTPPQSEPPPSVRAFVLLLGRRPAAGGTVSLPEFGSTEPNSGVQRLEAPRIEQKPIRHRDSSPIVTAWEGGKFTLNKANAGFGHFSRGALFAPRVQCIQLGLESAARRRYDEARCLAHAKGGFDESTNGICSHHHTVSGLRRPFALRVGATHVLSGG